MSERGTVVEALLGAAERFPKRGYTFVSEKSAAGSSETFLSFPHLAERVAQTAAALRRQGLRRGDRVALALPDTLEFVTCFLGSMYAGLIPVPMYPPLRIGQLGHYLDHVRYILQQSGASILVTAPPIKAVLGSLVSATLRSITTVPSLGIDERGVLPSSSTLSDVAFLQFTSGSTARPKGVTLTYGNLDANAKCIRDGLRLGGDDIGCSWLPLFHDMGLIGFVLTPFYTGTPVVFLPPLTFLKQPAEWLRRMTKHRATISFAPNFGYGLCTSRIRENDLAGIDLSGWRIAGCGAEPIQRKTLDLFAERFAPVGFRRSAFLLAYGLAESTLAVSFSPAEDDPVYEEVDFPSLSTQGVVAEALDGVAAVTLANLGRPFEGHAVAILDSDGEPLPEHRVGEVALRGPSVTPGYWNDPVATSASTRGEWFLTGDQGFLANGDVFICGRNKELIIFAGRNYHPADIEWVAAEIPGIRRGRVVAFGVTTVAPDGSTSERVVICAESKARPETREELTGAVKARVLDSLGVRVSEVMLLDRSSLPRTSSGKLQRTKAREWFLAGRLDTAGDDEGKLALVRHLFASQWGFLRGRMASLLSRRADVATPES
jgi:fatty-acyl-CoA synthase